MVRPLPTSQKLRLALPAKKNCELWMLTPPLPATVTGLFTIKDPEAVSASETVVVQLSVASTVMFLATAASTETCGYLASRWRRSATFSTAVGAVATQLAPVHLTLLVGAFAMERSACAGSTPAQTITKLLQRIRAWRLHRHAETPSCQLHQTTCSSLRRVGTQVGIAV